MLLSATGDAFEDNDLRSDAAVIEAGALSDQGGLATADDDDWYRIDARAGAFEATLSDSVAQGDLDYELYDGSGGYLAGNYNNADTAILSTELAEDGSYYIYVFSDNGDRQGNTYNLATAFSPLTPVSDPGVPDAPAGEPDGFERNNSRDEAATAQSTLTATATDDDWYRLNADGEVRLTYDASEGPLGLEVYGTDGGYLGGSYGGSGSDAVAASGDVLVYVFSLNGERRGNVYALTGGTSETGSGGAGGQDQDQDQPGDGGTSEPGGGTGGAGAGDADRFEVNNDRDSAALIAGTITATATDDDWYRLESTGELTLTYDADQGPLGLEVYDTAGNYLGGNYAGGGVDVVSADGQVLAYVFSLGGDRRGNVYTLAGAAAADDGSGGGSGGSATAGVPDGFEANNVPDLATAIDRDISATATDDDWYRLTADGEVRLDYAASEGPLGLEVYDITGGYLGGSYGGSGVDRVAASGEVLAYVFSLNGDRRGNTYTLSGVAGGSQSGGGDDDGGAGNGGNNGNNNDGGSAADRFEDNDVFDQAANAGGLIEATATDDDWYRIDSSGELRLTYNVTDGPLGLEVYDTDGNYLGGSYTFNGNEVVQASGEVVAYVFSNGGNHRGNAYTLSGARGDGSGSSGGSNTGGSDNDLYEPNDTRDAAAAIEGRVLARATDNPDWFTAESGGTVSLDYDAEPGDAGLSLEVYARDGELIGVDMSGLGAVVVEASGPVDILVTNLSDLRTDIDYALTVSEPDQQDGDGDGDGGQNGDGDGDGGDLPILTGPASTDVSGTVDASERNQTIVGLGTAAAWYLDEPEFATRSIYNEAGFSDLFYGELGSSALRFEMPVTVLSSSRADKPTDAEMTNEVRLGADTQANINLFNFDAWGVGHVGRLLQDAPEDFKLIGTLWSPPHWMKGQQVDWFSGEPVFYPDGPIPDWEVRYDQPGAPDLPYWKTDLTEDPFLEKNWRANTIGGTLKTDADTLEQFGRYVVAYLKGFEQAYGVPFYSFAIQNEPLAAQDSTFANSYNSQVLDPERYRIVTEAVQAAFDAYNAANPDDPILTKLHGAEQYGPGNTNDPWFQWSQHRYTEALGNSNAIDAISIHGSELGVPVDLSGATRNGEVVWDWFINGQDDGNEPDWAGVADYGLPLWMTEHSGEASVWLTSGGQGPENGALALGIRMFDTLVYGDAEMYLHWQTTSTGDRNRPVEGADLTSGINSEQPKFAAFSQFSRHVRPGMDRLDVASSDRQVLITAFENDQTGDLATVLINMKGESETVRVALPDGFEDDDLLDAYVSSVSQFHERIGRYDVAADGTVAVEIPAYGIMTLVGDSNPFA